MQAEIFVENVAALVAMTAKYAIKDAMSGEWRKHYQPPAPTAKERAGGVTVGPSTCWCGNGFTPKRKSQKFCSNLCRILFHRKGMSV